MRTRGVPTRAWFLLFTVAATALVLGTARSAGAATNLVPNPGFETDCTGVPCNWSVPFGGGTLTRDTSTSHSGSASLKFVQDGTTQFAGPASDCVDMPLAAGPHAASAWYLTNDATTGSVGMAGNYYPGANCTGIPIGFSNAITPVLGAWTETQFNFVVPSMPAIESIKFVFIIGAVTTGDKPAVNYDDYDFESGLLAVSLASFTAVRSHPGVVLRWRTGTEANELGFNVYRQRAGRRARLNRRLLPAVGGISGTSYSFRDRRAPQHRALRYWLQDVDRSGHRTWHGPVRVAAS